MENQKFNLAQNGDSLEREYHAFIKVNLPNYEKVWQIFVGNNGKNELAEIPNYPLDANQKRIQYSQNAYTVLQSIIILKTKIIDNEDCFKLPEDFTINNILQIYNSIFMFFSHIGRIQHTILKAAHVTSPNDNQKISESIKEIYNTRSIIVHGKTIPIVIKEDLEIEIPILNWKDEFEWAEGSSNLDSIEKIKSFFWDFIPKINHAFGLIQNRIESELNEKGYKISHENHTGISGISNLSGTSPTSGSFSDGNAGSSGFGGTKY